MRKVIFVLVMLTWMVMPVFAQEAETAETKEATALQPQATEKTEVISATDGYVCLSGSSAGLNTFVIVNLKEKDAYTFNAYGNGGSKWKYQDLTALEPKKKK